MSSTLIAIGGEFYNWGRWRVPGLTGLPEPGTLAREGGGRRRPRRGMAREERDWSRTATAAGRGVSRGHPRRHLWPDTLPDERPTNN